MAHETSTPGADLDAEISLLQATIAHVEDMAEQLALDADFYGDVEPTNDAKAEAYSDAAARIYSALTLSGYQPHRPNSPRRPPHTPA